MFHKYYGKIITVLLISMLLNTYIFKIEVFNVILGLFVFGIAIYANRFIFKKLTMKQNMMMLLLLIGTITLLVGFFYFIAGPIVQLIPFSWLQSVMKIILTIGAFIPAMVLLFKGMSIISDGKFPNVDIESETQLKEYPKNEEIEQLIHNGESIKAVKRVREIYGYSLLEAKRYVDHLQ